MVFFSPGSWTGGGGGGERERERERERGGGRGGGGGEIVRKLLEYWACL